MAGQLGQDQRTSLQDYEKWSNERLIQRVTELEAQLSAQNAR